MFFEVSKNFCISSCSGCSHCQWMERKSADLNRKYDFSGKRKLKKAGVFFYNTENNSVILVSSDLKSWGFPKGSFDDIDNDNYIHCAIREVKEETGMILSPEVLQTARYFRTERSLYFFVEYDTEEFKTHILNQKLMHDIVGITSIRIECLKEALESGRILLNSAARKCLTYFLNVKLENKKNF